MPKYTRSGGQSTGTAAASAIHSGMVDESKCCAVPHTISWTSQHLGHRASEVVFLDLFGM